mmetsp:Transcript_32409/g.81562  ORF Transcript_32409/g.81562 Transcript_32409/m.81562 type:complete len:349 (+) Transcript_32409:254-1300(+)
MLPLLQRRQLDQVLLHLYVGEHPRMVDESIRAVRTRIPLLCRRRLFAPHVSPKVSAPSPARLRGGHVVAILLLPRQGVVVAALCPLLPALQLERCLHQLLQPRVRLVVTAVAVAPGIDFVVLHLLVLPVAVTSPGAQRGRVARWATLGRSGEGSGAGLAGGRGPTRSNWGAALGALGGVDVRSGSDGTVALLSLPSAGSGRRTFSAPLGISRQGRLCLAALTGENPAQGGVESVFHLVIRPPGDGARDDGPLVAADGVRRENLLVLLLRERPALHGRIELVAPPQAAALAGPVCQRPGDGCPVARPAQPFYLLVEQRILLGRPRVLHHPLILVVGERHRSTPADVVVR